MLARHRALAISCLIPLLVACGTRDSVLPTRPPDRAEQPTGTDIATHTPMPPDDQAPLGPGRSTGEPGEWLRGPFYLDQIELLILESYPYQVRMILRGSLPTPCATLHWSVEPADEQGRIQVELCSLSDPNLACIQILHSIEESIPLGSFTEGSYSIWVNGELVEEFEL